MDSYDLFIDGKLPEPLTLKQFSKYLDQYNNGDKNAKDIIIVHNIRLVLERVIRRFGNSIYDKKELTSVGLIGLIKAFDTYDISKNVKFNTYAVRCIDNEILMFIKKEKNQSNNSFEDVFCIDKDGKEFSNAEKLFDERIDLVSDYERKESIIETRKLVNSLQGREKEIILLYFGFYNDRQYTQKEIADKYHISKSYVSKVLNDTLKKLRSRLENKSTVTNQINPRHGGKKIKSIYEYFAKYPKEQVDEVLSKLSDDEKYLIKLRYGDDLEHPVKTEGWSNSYKNKFYGVVLTKIKKTLENSFYKDEGIIPKEENDKKIITNSDFESGITDEKIKNDCIKILEVLRISNFNQMLEMLSPTEIIIATLKLGYVDEKYFSTESISKFLETSEDEVRETTKKVLLVCKENINQIIDSTIEEITKEQNRNPVLQKRLN